MSRESIQPKYVFLLERYKSIEYFGELRDAWGEMILHLENCLDSFMRNLPADYRSRQLPEQPDLVWGEKVLPNFRDTFQGLCTGYIKLSHGDASGLHFAHGPSNDAKGQSDFWDGWMSLADQNTYGRLLHEAVEMARNIWVSEGAYWKPLDLSARAVQIDELSDPKIWPSYRVSPKVSVLSGSKTPQNGIYVPDVPNSCMQFLSTKYAQAPEAIVLAAMEDLLHPVNGDKYGEQPLYRREKCTWHLIERCAQGTDITPVPNLTGEYGHRLVAGDFCRVAGYYFTPSRKDSRRRFENNEVMPDFDTGYGATIWQWDSNQN